MHQHISLQLASQNKRVQTAKIVSVGTHLPSQIVKSDHLFEEINSDTLYGIATNWMSKNMGIIERRMSEIDCEPSELAIPAARKAIESIPNFNPKEIGLVIFCGIERDQPEPATAHTIQNALGLQANITFDVANACLGFIDGMRIATNFIESGTIKYALVVTGEVSTRVLRSFVKQLKQGVTRAQAYKLVGGLSVGDAGGAVVLGPAEPEQKSGFKYFNSNVDSGHTDKCIYRVKKDGEIEGQMLMAKILAQGIKMHRDMIDDTLDRLNWDNFDWVLSHQTGKRNFEEFSKFRGVDKDRMIRTYDLYGNTTSATLPLGWEKLINSGMVCRGDKIGGLFAGSGLATCQFGAYF